jgi:hypothetical protein
MRWAVDRSLPYITVRLKHPPIQHSLTGDPMADLSKDEIKSLGRAVSLELEEPLLTEVAYNLNALRDLIDEVNPAELDQVEPLPIIPPHERSPHE